jgi:hypothetical protein
MKKSSLLILAILAASVSLFAQESELNIGAKMGANLNQFSQTGVHTGLNIGGFALYNLSEKLGVQGDLTYNAIGAIKNDYFLTSTNPNQTLQYVDRSVTSHNAELAAVLKYNLGSSADVLKPKVFIGAAYGYAVAVFEKHDLVATTYIDGGMLQSRSGSSYENVGDTYEAHQFAGIFGVSFDYLLSNGKIFTTEVRYRRGLNDLSNYPGNVGVGDAWANTISINFGLSIY